MLTGFGDALAGDPLVDAAVLLGMSPEQLGPVLGAVDGDWLDAWLEPEALARIEAYHLSWCLAQICQIGEYYALDHDLHRLANLERVGRHLHLALEPGFAERRLGAARQCAGDVPWVAVGFDAPAARLRVALALLGTDPAPPIEQALSVAGVLGAQLLAARLALWPDAGEQSTRIEACARVGWSTQPVVRPGPHPDCEPLADVDRWSRGLVGDVLRHPHRGGSSALVLLWVGLEALARVDHEVTGAVHRGLERLVRATACTEGLDAASARRRLVHALLGLAALHGLREQLGLPEHDVERRADDLREQLQDASAELDLDWRASPGAPPGLAPLEEVEDWTREQAVQGLDTHRAGQLRPLLVYALCRLHGELALPGGPGWVIERAGL